MTYVNKYVCKFSLGTTPTLNPGRDIQICNNNFLIGLIQKKVVW